MKKSTLRSGEEAERLAELASGAVEHRSPVSVLDVSEYTADAPSPIKEEPNSLKGTLCSVSLLAFQLLLLYRSHLGMVLLMNQMKVFKILFLMITRALGLSRRSTTRS